MMDIWRERWWRWRADVPASERRVWEGKRLLSFGEKALSVELLAFVFMCSVCTRDLRRVVGVDVLDEGLEELGELPRSLITQFRDLQYQTVTRSHVIVRLGGVGHGLL